MDACFLIIVVAKELQIAYLYSTVSIWISWFSSGWFFLLHALGKNTCYFILRILGSQIHEKEYCEWTKTGLRK